jgi:hypothetical protein
MDQRLNRKILLAAVLELQQLIDEMFLRGHFDVMEKLSVIQIERVDRLNESDYDTRHGDSGTQ